MGVKEMGNTVPKAGLETHISGIPGQCATITTHSHHPMPMPSCLYIFFPQRSVQTTTLAKKTRKCVCDSLISPDNLRLTVYYEVILRKEICRLDIIDDSSWS